VVRTIPPCDYQIQRNRRSLPITVHGDKLKPCYSDTPPSWIQTEVTPLVAVDSAADRQGHEYDDSAPAESPQPMSESQRPAVSGVRRPRRRRDYQPPELMDLPRQLPVRQRRPPGRFADYQM